VARLPPGGQSPRRCWPPVLCAYKLAGLAEQQGTNTPVHSRGLLIRSIVAMIVRCLLIKTDCSAGDGRCLILQAQAAS